MRRILYFFAAIIIPIVFGWWLFIPMALLFVYLSKLPYEIIIAGSVLDSVYYFGESFIAEHQLTAFSLTLIMVALFLNERIRWRKII